MRFDSFSWQDGEELLGLWLGGEGRAGEEKGILFKEAIQMCFNGNSTA